VSIDTEIRNVINSGKNILKEIRKRITIPDKWSMAGAEKPLVSSDTNCVGAIMPDSKSD